MQSILFFVECNFDENNEKTSCVYSRAIYVHWLKFDECNHNFCGLFLLWQFAQPSVIFLFSFESWLFKRKWNDKSNRKFILFCVAWHSFGLFIVDDVSFHFQDNARLFHFPQYYWRFAVWYNFSSIINRYSIFVNCCRAIFALRLLFISLVFNCNNERQRLYLEFNSLHAKKHNRVETNKLIIVSLFLTIISGRFRKIQTSKTSDAKGHFQIAHNYKT